MSPAHGPRRHQARVTIVAAAASIGLAVTGAVAYAAIPDAGGVIHGCYAKPGLSVLGAPGGTLRVIDSPSENCRSSEAALTWNQTGPQGPAGPTGPVGPAGPAGAQGPAGPAVLTVQRIEAEKDVDAHGAAAAFARCPEGTVLSGGGFIAHEGVEIRSSFPGRYADEWIVDGLDRFDFPSSVVAYALCIRAG